MATHPDYPRTRLFVEQPLAANGSVTLDEKQSHYLTQVLRQKEGGELALFNGTDGEWRAVIASVAKKSVTLSLLEPLRPQTTSSDNWLLCAPLKNAKSEWVVEKATELGIARILPVTTKHTIVDRVNDVRWQAIATEASEQCERLDIPTIDDLLSLEKCLGTWPANRLLIFADESGSSQNAKDVLPTLTGKSWGVLIGPEGGFSSKELELLRSLPYGLGLSLGPRILRADTAAIASLALLQAWSGDWDGKPAFRNA